MLQKSIAALITALGTVILIWFIGLLWFAAHVTLLEVKHREVKTDAIVVLTGGKGRVATGLSLLKSGLSGQLFISGVNKDTTVQDLIKGGNVPCCITLGYAAHDTEGNAAETGAWAKGKSIHSIRLVTSSYHMPRAVVIFKAYMPGVMILQHPVSQEDIEPGEEKFWRYIFAEYNKTLATLLKLSLNKSP